MDINILMNRIVRHLGLSALSLENYYPLIRETLANDTLPMLSQFFPYEYTLTKKLSEEHAEVDADYGKIYYIKDQWMEANNVSVISVMAVQGASIFQDWNAPLQTFNIDAMILEGAASSIRSQLNISTKSFRFMPPNRVKLRGFGGSEEVKITCKVSYPNWGYVSDSIMMPAEQLAKLDVKATLYPELKMYDKIETAQGSIDLKIDDWANAERERMDLLESWRDRAFPNSVINGSIMGKPMLYE